jgi:seryl-tRNA synthetase
MIDISLLKTNYEEIAQRIAKKDPSFPTEKLLSLQQTVHTVLARVEELRAQKNALSSRGPVTPELREQSIAIGKELKQQETALATAQEELNTVWLCCPNIPLDDVPVGNKESNVAVRSWGTNPVFDFPIKNHMQLNEQNKWFDLEAGTKMAGTQFVFYTPLGTKILYALTQLMLKNNAAHGFEPVLPPYMATEQALYNSSNLPKFAGDFYKVEDENLNLIPTAEVSLTNLHAGEILDEGALPRRYTAWTSCFRREAGGYGAQERGIIRIHQFEKVELYALVKPEQSADELDRMVACAESLLQKLNLSYQVSLLAGQDCSFASAKTYDIEVWLPGQDKHYEVSSASNCTDFQARRAKIRYRGSEMKKPALVHTLNASSLALPRLMVALMEQGQQADGSIILPPALQEMMDTLW